MITVVMGKPDSGKSKMAEDMAVAFGGRRYYVATMAVMDDEGRRRVERHRAQRAGKGFETLEILVNITSAFDMIDRPEDSTVLLECMANLVGNEMHSRTALADLCREDESGADDFSQRMSEQIAKLGQGVRELIVVTSEYEPDVSDDDDTALYKKVLSAVNSRLCDIADKVYDSKKGGGS